MCIVYLKTQTFFDDVLSLNGKMPKRKMDSVNSRRNFVMKK